MSNANRRQILRDRIDQISVTSVKSILDKYKKNKTFSYKEVEELLTKCTSVYKEQLTKLLRVMTLEAQLEQRKPNESKEKIST